MLEGKEGAANRIQLKKHFWGFSQECQQPMEISAHKLSAADLITHERSEE